MRVVALFGHVGAGITTITRVLHDASTTRTHVLSWTGDDDDLVLACDVVREGKPVPEVLFIDALRSAEELVALVQAGYVTADGGCVIQLQSNVLISEPTRHAHNALRAQLEDVVRMHMLPYYTINNVLGDLEAPVGMLARWSKIRK